MELTKNNYLDEKAHIKTLETMLLARHGDVREQRLIRQGKGWFHVSGMGHESMACMNHFLKPEDYCFPFYRDRAFVMGRGITTYELALSFYAKKESSSAGKQLPGHYSNRRLNIWSHPSPIASHLLPACGAAWGLQLDGKKDSVVFASVGDGGSRQGDFFEAICFAKEKNLPVIFVVQDNRFAISTPTKEITSLALDLLPKEEWLVADGTNVVEVAETFALASQKARSGEGPQFLWYRLERLSSHSSADDHRNYRSEEELQAIDARDPIQNYINFIVSKNILSQNQIDNLQEKIAEAVKQDYVKAEKAADPHPGDQKKQIFGSIGIGAAPCLLKDKDYRMADAINLTFKEILKTNPDTYFFGEDIEDPLGGVFKLTKGLSTEFSGRIYNSPLAESSILGIASGLASYGKRPIFEIQFIDFISPGWNQLVNNLANLRWRSHGNWTCPAIIYAPCGGYLPGGAIWHSQTNESVFAHYPGLLVIVPSTPADASGLLLSALACEDPVLFLIPKHLLWVPQKNPQKLEPIPLGKAAVRQEGDDLTLLAWGNCAEIAQKAIEKIGTKNSIELIDLRSIVPWDHETIFNSVLKTGRLVILQEDNQNCSVGEMIIAALCQNTEVWNKMVAPPVLVSKDNVHIGYNPIYEYSSLPDLERALKAIEKALSINKTHLAVSSITPSGYAASEAISEKINLPVTGGKETIKLPNLGEGLLEARVVEIFKKEGELLKQDDALCEVETDKAVFPVESPFEGTLEKWLIKTGDVVQVGQAIGEISVKAQSNLQDKKHISAQEDTHITTAEGALSPEIINQLQGVLPASLSVVADYTALRNARAKVRGRSKGGVFSYTTMVAWAVVQALKEFPAFRRLLKQGQISPPLEEFDIGFAVALEKDELETAVIPKANQLNWPEFVSAYRQALHNIRENAPQSKARTTVLLTSMGPLNIRKGTPIVVPPAVATLFIGEPYYELVESNTSKEVISLDLSFDHRWANGAGAGRFLKKIKDNIQNFNIEALDETTS